MNPTTLIYLEKNSLLSCPASIIAINNENEKIALILDQTIFYPQGGGQPCDTGTIASTSGKFNVVSVRFIEGIVYHFGTLEGSFQKGDLVTCTVDQHRRELHSRIHSAGHVIDMAVAQQGYDWDAGKGFHFPEGPYIEYLTDVNMLNSELLLKVLEEHANKIIKHNYPITFLFMEKNNLHTVCHKVPDYLPINKPTRVVMFEKFGIPCGGTHVQSLSEIKKITFRKIKLDHKNNIIKISYDIA